MRRFNPENAKKNGLIGGRTEDDNGAIGGGRYEDDNGAIGGRFLQRDGVKGGQRVLRDKSNITR